MKIFYSVKELIDYIDNNDELYFNDEYKEYGDKFINDCINENGNGVYCLDFGSRGEVDFEFVENFVEELRDWNNLKDDDEEIDIDEILSELEREEDSIDLGDFTEEDIRNFIKDEVRNRFYEEVEDEQLLDDVMREMMGE